MLGQSEKGFNIFVSGKVVTASSPDRNAFTGPNRFQQPQVTMAPLAADITVSGAGGLDTGSGAANTWYAVLVISDPVNSALTLLLTTTPNAPVLPGTYTNFRRIGWVRMNAGNTAFLAFTQIGRGVTRKYYYDEADSTLQALASGSATVFTSVSLAAFVPPGCREVSLRIAFSNTGGASSDGLHLRPTGSSQASPVNKIKAGVVLASPMNIQMDMVCDQNQSIDYMVDNAVDVAKIGIAAFVDDL